ncbi:MAG: LVIVD repeat-containing protein, partial [Bacteroidota bacterium]
MILLEINSWAATSAQTAEYAAERNTWRFASALEKRDSILSVVGRWAWGPGEAVDVWGDYAFIGNGAILQVLNVSNPSAPSIESELLLDFLIRDIRVRDSILFVVSGGLVIVDVSDPSVPKKIGWISIRFGPTRVTVEDSFAYVTVSAGGLHVVDITNLYEPKLRGDIPAGGQFPRCLAAKDQFVYVGNPEWPDLAVIDATNPDSLTRAFTSIGGWGISAYVRNTLLFVGVSEFDGNQSLKIFSVKNPALPVEIGRIVVGFPRSHELNSIIVDERYAFASVGEHGIVAVDISNPAQPQITDSRVFRSMVSYSIASSQGKVYTAYTSGLWTVDASEPNSLKHLTFFPTGGFAYKVFIKDTLAFVASGQSGLWILDVSNPQLPKAISNVNTESFTCD